MARLGHWRGPPADGPAQELGPESAATRAGIMRNLIDKIKIKLILIRPRPVPASGRDAGMWVGLGCRIIVG